MPETVSDYASGRAELFDLARLFSLGQEAEAVKGALERLDLTFQEQVELASAAQVLAWEWTSAWKAREAIGWAKRGAVEPSKRPRS